MLVSAADLGSAHHAAGGSCDGAVSPLPWLGDKSLCPSLRLHTRQVLPGHGGGHRAGAEAAEPQARVW